MKWVYILIINWIYLNFYGKSSQVVPLAGYDKHGRKVVIDISSKMSLEVASLEERQRVAMMAMDMAFLKPDEQVQINRKFLIMDKTVFEFSRVCSMI